MRSPRKTIDNGKNVGIRKSLLLMSKTCTFSQRKHLERKGTKKLSRRMESVRVAMKEISREQKSIRKGQREVKEKFEIIESECEQLRRETDFIIQQSFNTHLRLCLMFKILKARELNDFNKAAALTEILREVIAKQSKEM